MDHIGGQRQRQVRRPSGGGNAHHPVGRVYKADLVIGGSEASQPVDDFLPFVREKSTGEALPLLRDELMSRGKRAGVEWMRFTEHGREWKGAMLYLGDQSISARVVPPDDD